MNTEAKFILSAPIMQTGGKIRLKLESVYRCEICNTVYNNRDICLKCELNHLIPTEIKSCRYSPITVNEKGYPNSITIKFNDGSEAIYKRG